MEQQREKYMAPTVEVIHMEQEGVIAASGGNGGVSDMPGVNWNSTSGRSRNSYGSASTSDLEDLINDILTIEQ